MAIEFKSMKKTIVESMLTTDKQLNKTKDILITYSLDELIDFCNIINVNNKGHKTDIIYRIWKHLKEVFFKLKYEDRFLTEENILRNIVRRPQRPIRGPILMRDVDENKDFVFEENKDFVFNEIPIIEKKETEVFKLEIIKNESKNNCCICFDEIETNQRIFKLKCNHGELFHSDCLLLSFIKNSKSCPYCKSDV